MPFRMTMFKNIVDLTGHDEVSSIKYLGTNLRHSEYVIEQNVLQQQSNSGDLLKM